MNYTDAQRAAIAHSGSNLQILACAGSGKTQVLAARVVEVLRTGAAPENVVAFTFTDKAAAELKDRISHLAQTEFGRITGLAEMFAGTIHGYCLHILQTCLFRYLKYAVLSEVQTRLLVNRNSQKSGLQNVSIIAGPSRGKSLERNPQDVSVFLDAMNVLREDEVDCGSIPPALRDALNRYTALLDEHRYLDYSRLMLDALTSMRERGSEGRRLQASIAGRLKYLIVDEYQDVNPLQEAIIRQIHELGAMLCVVGDDDQTIYQWRGSEIRNILDFTRRYPAVHSETLVLRIGEKAGV